MRRMRAVSVTIIRKRRVWAQIKRRKKKKQEPRGNRPIKGDFKFINLLVVGILNKAKMNSWILQFSTIQVALLLFMEYVDLGKWVAATEGGSHLGLGLTLLLFFNFTAGLCHYLSSCICLVTGNNLAQQQRRQLNTNKDVVIQTHLFAIVFIFTSVFLVNAVIMNSAASVFNSYGFLVPSFQDDLMFVDQGILDPAFCKSRKVLSPCKCLQACGYIRESSGTASLTFRSSVLELIKEVQASTLKRKGPAGTGGGKIAFPKGKEILAQVLKRYKHRLANASP